ncbi:MAG: HD domain-containing protein [Armatimonadota bacterium]
MALDLERVWTAWRGEPAHRAVEETARELGQPVWIVGGAVRDALLGLPVGDWDLAVPEAPAFARALAQALGVHLTVLHEDLPTYRLVLKADDQPPRQLDLVQLRAATIEDDLLSRDLSINALAADLLTHDLLDPSGGLSDLQHGRVRALGLANLQADPLRCLRVYRFHSQFGFVVDGQTRNWVRQVSLTVGKTAGERIGEELLKTLEPPRAAQTVRMMDEDGLLSRIFPEIEPTRGVEQGGYHHLDVWGHTLEVAAELEQILLKPGRFLPRNVAPVEEYLSQRHRRPILLLTALLHDLAKPPCRKRDERGWWRFFDHDIEGARIAGHIARRLALRREHALLVRALIRNHLRPLQLANLQLPQDGREPKPITMSALRRLFRDAHPDGIGLLLLALSDARGCRGPSTRPGYHQELAMVVDEMLARFLEYREQRATTPLLSGSDLIEAGYTPGERFGVVLAEVEDAYADGVVHTKGEALELAAELFRRLQSEQEDADASVAKLTS